jgi:two-component system, cell cycle response regulator
MVVVGFEQEWAARSLESVLAPAGYAVVRAYSGSQTLDLAEVVSPDLVLVASRLPDMDGVDVCRALRTEQRVGVHVPVVLVTSGPAARDVIRAAYAAGAWAVWEQPIDGELLLLRLRSWIESKRATDRGSLHRLVESESGLYTKEGLDRRSREVLADAARNRTPVSVIAIGAARAPWQPDAQVADMVSPHVITRIGCAVAALTRGSDIVGRMSASELGVIAPATPVAGARELVERLRDYLASQRQPDDAADERVDLYAGVASTMGDASNTDGVGLLHRALTALRFAQASRAPTIRTFDDVPAAFA